MVIKILGKVEGRAVTPLPFVDGELSAGFPSQADDFLERPLDLHDLLVAHPTATFFVRVEGDSMMGAGMQSGDILVVDRSLEPTDGKIVVALLDGEFTVKRLRFHGEQIVLMPENPRYAPIKVEREREFQVWGVVTYVIHRSC